MSKCCGQEMVRVQYQVDYIVYRHYKCTVCGCKVIPGRRKRRIITSPAECCGQPMDKHKVDHRSGARYQIYRCNTCVSYAKQLIQVKRHAGSDTQLSELDRVCLSCDLPPELCGKACVDCAYACKVSGKEYDEQKVMARFYPHKKSLIYR